MKTKNSFTRIFKFSVTLAFAIFCFFFFIFVAEDSSLSDKNIASMTLELCGNFVCAVFIGSCLLDNENSKKSNRYLIDCLFLVSIVYTSDFLLWYMQNLKGQFYDFLNYILNAVYFYVLLKSLFAFTRFFNTFLKAEPSWLKTYLKAVNLFKLIFIAGLAVNYFVPFIFDVVDGHYIRYFGTYIFSVITELLIIVYTVLINREDIDKQEMITLLAYIVLPLLGTVAQMLFTGYSFISLAAFLVVLLMYVHGHIRQQQLLQKSRIKLQEQNTALMLSQIQPHFLFNTLNTVVALCDIDPQLAKKATLDFSDYLEHNLSSISKKKPVPFETELKHVKAYLNIEQIRFGKLLNVKYDIKTSNFSIPSLTVQPLVENAVKHGVMKKIEGGTVTITTEESQFSYTVMVSDDGVGFNTSNATVAGHGIGINNIRNRIVAQCNGTLTIESTPGKGTVAMIRIPKEKKL